MMKTQNLRLASLKLEEEQAQYYIERALQVFDVNLVGPQDYVAQYAKYVDLLTAKAEREAETFLMETRTIDEMKAVSLLLTYLSVFVRDLISSLSYLYGGLAQLVTSLVASTKLINAGPG